MSLIMEHFLETNDITTTIYFTLHDVNFEY